MNDPGNYRGISLLSILSKVYTHIINSRLTLWVESNFVLTDAQAGFRKGRSTVDHIFTLHAAIERQFANNSKLRSLILRKPTILLIATVCGRYCSEAVSKVEC